MLSTDTTSVTPGKEVPAIITNDITVYSIFEEDSVYNNILDEKYLNFSGGILTFNANTIGAVKGKITLPLRYNNVAVESFGSGSQPSPALLAAVANITHIFWQQPTDEITCEVTQYNNQTFRNWTNLIYVEIPNNNFWIGQYCFQQCNNLFNSVKITDLERAAFFSKIVNYGSYCFANITNSNYENLFLNNCNNVIVINANTNSIGTRAFYQSYVRNLIFGSANAPYLYPNNIGSTSLPILADAGYGSDKTNNKPTVIFYYKNNLYDNTFASVESLQATLADRMGISGSNITMISAGG